MVWYGVVWFGVVWCDVVYRGVMWYMVWYVVWWGGAQPGVLCAFRNPPKKTKKKTNKFFP